MVKGREFHLVFISNTQTYHGSGNNSKGEASLPVTSPRGTLPNWPKKLIWLMVHLVLLPVMLLLKTSHNGDWMPPSQPAREGNNNTLAGKNTGKGCRGQVRSAPIEAGAKCDNSVVTMLICTQPTVTSVKTPISHPTPKGTICPFLCIPSNPPDSSHPFRSISEVTFPCHRRSPRHPGPFFSLTLVTFPVSPIFFGVNIFICKQPWTLVLAAFHPSCEARTIGVALEPAQCRISDTMGSCICSGIMPFPSTQPTAIEQHLLSSSSYQASHPTHSSLQLNLTLDWLECISALSEVYLHSRGLLLLFSNMLNITVRVHLHSHWFFFSFKMKHTHYFYIVSGGN